MLNSKMGAGSGQQEPAGVQALQQARGRPGQAHEGSSAVKSPPRPALILNECMRVREPCRVRDTINTPPDLDTTHRFQAGIDCIQFV